MPTSLQTVKTLENIMKMTLGQVWLFNSFPEENHTLTNLQKISSIPGITEAHALVFKAFLKSQFPFKHLKRILTFNVSKAQAYAFLNWTGTKQFISSDVAFEKLSEFCKVAMSETQEKIFLALQLDLRTEGAFKEISDNEYTTEQSQVFCGFDESCQNLEILKKVRLLDITEIHVMAFCTIEELHTYELLESVLSLKLTITDVLAFGDKASGSRTFYDLKAASTTLFRGINIAANEAMVTSIIRSKMIPFVNDALNFYEVPTYLVRALDHSAPFISKAVVLNAPNIVVSTGSSYVLRYGLPKTLKDLALVGSTIGVSYTAYSFVPKPFLANPYAKALLFCTLVAGPALLGGDQKSAHDVLYQVAYDNSEPLTAASLIFSVSVCGFGAALSTSALFGLGTAILANNIYVAYNSYQKYQTEKALQDILLNSHGLHGVGEVVGDVANYGNHSSDV